LHADSSPFTALFSGGFGGTPYKHERSDLCLARRAIRGDWLPDDAQAKRVALVEHFLCVMRRYGKDGLDRNARLTLTAIGCLIECESANERKRMKILRDSARLHELLLAFSASTT
jgi:hypothetical protein